MSEPAFHDVEQNSAEWMALRAGVPTASEFGKLITGTGKVSAQAGDYAAKLAADAYAGKATESWEGNQHTRLGHEREPMAAAYYEFMTGRVCEPVGFVTCGPAGCSPDRLVADDGVLEIKSLMGKEHVKVLAYYAKHQRPPPDYFPQCQGEMLVTCRAWNDLLYFHPDLPSLIIRIERDDEYIALLETAIADVCQKRDEYLDVLGRTT